MGLWLNRTVIHTLKKSESTTEETTTPAASGVCIPPKIEIETRQV